MKTILLAVAILAIAGSVYAAEPSNPSPAKTRAEHMADIYRAPAGETFNQGGGDAAGDAGDAE